MIQKTKGQKLQRKFKGKIKHSSAMSNTAWCDLNTKGQVLKIHEMCPNPRCKCQKQKMFTARQFQLERAGFTKTVQKNFNGIKTTRKKISKACFQCGSSIY